MNIGPYEVLSKIGQGGMGAVYRARDPRLDRLVAIKLLLDDAASDPMRRERFLREARAAAGLTHPNIVTIHSVEEDAGRIFLTMEYVDGGTLSDAVQQGGMPLDRLLALAIPLTDAVAAAHERGIVHRDLKPSNVMIGRDARVKVLDFGLAKLREAPGPGPGSVTMAAPAPISVEGVILGTVAYMAPEQAEGRSVDHRTDIFALGVMLYEMATGRRPFVGDTTAALIAAILRDMPAPVTEVNADMPAELARIVRRCLAKDPTRRYQTALDVRTDLEELERDIGLTRADGRAGATLDRSSGASNAHSSSAGSRPGRDLREDGPTPGSHRGTSSITVPARSHRWVVPAVVSLLLTAAVASLVVYRYESRQQTLAVATPSFLERQVTSNPAEDPVWYAAISPDGKYIAYGDFTGIHLRLIDTGETRTIPVPEGICFT